MRVGDQTLTVPQYGCVLVEPQRMRQVFNDSEREALWLIVGVGDDGDIPREAYYPEDPATLPAELAGKTWPPPQ